MKDHWAGSSLAVAAAALLGLVTPCLAATGDADASGFVDLEDYFYFEFCLSISGPDQTPIFEECLPPLDDDDDGDVDLKDFAAFQRALGYHAPYPLKDYEGNVIQVDSTAPYSGRETCGDCHDVDEVTNGFLFQMGRTDLDRSIIMQDDYFGDGRFWIKSPGRYGVWGQSFVYQLAAKDNDNESQIEQTTFAWVRDCCGCHPGGGPGEFDRDGVPLYNEQTSQFGWEVTGEDPLRDGDYTDVDYSTGYLGLARWDQTSVWGPDCLYCHRRERTVLRGVEQEIDLREGFRGAGRGDAHFTWRRGVVSTGTTLVDDQGERVPAFAAAGAAGQGWFSNLDLEADPPVLQIDYSVGVGEGSLLADQDGFLSVPPGFMVRPPRDKACVNCHPLAVVTGSVWFDERDVMYRRFNNLHDADPDNDIPPERSTACNYCHPGGLHHNFAKGNSPQIQFRNEIDWLNFRSCRECHLSEIESGVPNPLKHPDAPGVPGTSQIHLAGTGEAGPLHSMSCQGCHVPYALTGAVVFRDITIPGSVGTTAQYYSADPLDPTDPDKSTWYPALIWKEDSDGLERLFPANVWINIYWGDWDQNDTPEDLSDDVISPILSWRISQVVGSEPLAVVTDDNGDGTLEINRPEEILAYIELLKGNDSYGRQVAARPVLVRGIRVWYEDSEAPEGVSAFDHRGTGIPITSYPYVWGMDHNVLAASEGWGAGFPPSCGDCHDQTGQSPVFDRVILVDPYGPDGQPVYETVRQQTGASPP